jgi:hypothetical protein
MARRHLLSISAIGIAAMLLLAGCGGGGSSSTPTAGVAATASATATQAAGSAGSTLTLTSDAFVVGGTIPATYSCTGAGTSPALAWSGAPAGTQSFALIVHDPDAPLAGGFTHWIAIDLPGSAMSLPAAVPTGAIAGGGSQPIAYRGICPPVEAAAHHYHFRLYALDTTLGSGAGVTKESVEAAMQGHVLAQTDLVGLFGR